MLSQIRVAFDVLLGNLVYYWGIRIELMFVTPIFGPESNVVRKKKDFQKL